ncbi:hypothetical protein BVC80_1543g43 [Macleaya cordata]|uniref:Meiosis-specific protein ASY3-like coiled-coil domain-containing protein n=1 Tax=Macleaya cordata TaxID=56857 RepID=A0A200R1P7_MACCD|nr:hypothetical protein BVC80_1543g43 [Macleaya cordata]
MELKQRRSFRDEPSNCRSFGSDNLPCSQSRKISIGVMAEEPLKGDGTRKEDETTLPNVEKAASSGGKFIEENNKGPGVAASLKGKQTNTSERENSPWISTRSLCQETPTTKSVQFYGNRTSLLQSGDGTKKKFKSTSELPKTKTVKIFANRTSILQYGDGVQKQFNTMNEAPMSKTVQFYANQTSILHSSNDVQEKFDSITYGRMREKGGRTERVEEFAFAAAQEIHVSDKGAEGKKEKTACQSNESLKMKLWEILGTAPSQNERKSNSQTLEVGVKNSRLAGNLYQKSSRAVKPRQNSDTIETDSESPPKTARRPVTRSLARKKASTKAQPKFQNKIDNGRKLPSSSNNRQQCQEKNIFTFHEAEGWSGGLQGSVNGGSCLLTSKKTERKSIRVEPRRINFFDKVDPEKSKRPSSEKKTTSHSNRTESFHSHRSQTNIESLQPKIGNVEEDLHHSPARKKVDRQEDPKLPKKADSQDNFGVMPLKKNMTQQDNVNSPTLGMKTTIENYSPSPPSQRVKPMEPGVLNPGLVERRFTSEGFCKLRTSQTSKPGSSGSDAQTESSDGIGSLTKSPTTTRELSHVKEKDAEDRMSQSSKEQDVESLEEDVPINKGNNLSRICVHQNIRYNHVNT